MFSTKKYNLFKNNGTTNVRVPTFYYVTPSTTIIIATELCATLGTGEIKIVYNDYFYFFFIEK